MDDRVDAVLSRMTPADELLVAAVADNKRHAGRDRPVVAGGKIVEHDHALAGIDEFKHHVAADIAGSAGDQDRHERVSRNNL